MSDCEGVKKKDAWKGRIEFKFPLIIFKTQKFTSLYNRLGAFAVSRAASWVALIVMPIVAGIGVYLVFNALFTLLTNPMASEAIREVGPQAYLSLPGINPYLPILYGWMSIVVGIVVHEGAHGVIARSLGFNVKSSGLIFLLVVPVGAFVDIDEKQLAEAEARDSVRVLSAGLGANIAVSLVCIVGVLIITSGLSPMVDGLYVFEVKEGMPAIDSGLLLGDVIIRLDDNPITTLEDFTDVLEDKIPDDVVRVTVARGEMWRDRFFTSVKLADSDGKAVLGVVVGEMLIEQRLRLYQKLSTETPFVHFLPPALAQGLIPFSEDLTGFYTHPLGEHWHVLANTFFWLWWMNINFAIFNALPIYPLDGGQAFKNFLKSVLGRRTTETMVSRLTYIITVIMIAVIVMMIFLPFIM